MNLIHHRGCGYKWVVEHSKERNRVFVQSKNIFEVTMEPSV